MMYVSYSLLIDGGSRYSDRRTAGRRTTQMQPYHCNHCLVWGAAVDDLEANGLIYRPSPLSKVSRSNAGEQGSIAFSRLHGTMTLARRSVGDSLT